MPDSRGFDWYQFGGFRESDKTGPLTTRPADMRGGTTLIAEGDEMKVVRRLTPMECERLQGYPDNWTDIGEWTDSKGKKHECADSARYKALGNSIALPFWQRLAIRISSIYDRDITMASLFDGIGGFPYSFERCGNKAVWASEIEEFPIAVTKIRFPNMIHMGDITKINGAEVPVVDVITGGSPCQDLSVAGKRAGLAGERSGLFMEQMRIVKEMREHDGELHSGRADELLRPRYMVWENVPGAFSSGDPKGADFAAVIEETIKIVEPSVHIEVPEKGWPHSGCYYAEDGSWSIAYTLHDAQFYGVPQRRKRIALLADFNGLTAPTIMFNPQYWRETERTDSNISIRDIGRETEREVQSIGKSLSRHPEQGKQEGEETAGDTGAGAERANYTLKIRGGVDTDSNGKRAGKGALIQTELSGTLGATQDQTLFCLEGNGQRPSHSGDGYAESQVGYTLNSTEQHGVVYDEDKALGLGIQSSNGIGAGGVEVMPTLINGDNPGWQNGVMTT